MNVPELLNAFPRDHVLASGPFVTEVTLEDELIQGIGFDLQQTDNELSWNSVDHQHSQPLKGSVRAEGDQLHFTREDGAEFTLRPVEPGDGKLVDYDDTELLDLEPTVAQRELLEQLNAGWLEERDAPAAPAFTSDDLIVALDGAGQPTGLFQLSGSRPTLQRVQRNWKRVSPDAEDELFGVSDVDVLPGAVAAWDAGELEQVLAQRTDAWRTAPQMERIFTVLSAADDEDQLLGLFAERSRGRVYQRTNRNWSLITRDEVPAGSTLDVSNAAVSAWDDGTLHTLTDAEQYDLDGDTP